MTQLIGGIACIVLAFGILAICIPRHGKTAWVVGKPFLEPGLAILVVAGISLGVLFATGQFSTIDDMNMAGTVSR